MKISVSSYSFADYQKMTGCDYETICRAAKEMGYDGIEFTELQPCTIATAKKLRACCEALNLPIVCYSVGANFVRLFPNQTVKMLKKQVDIAAALGAPVMRHDVCYALAPGKSWQAAADKMAPYIREVTEYAKTKGIRTCTENHGFIFQEPERVKYLIDKVDNENYRWLCDMGNFLCAGVDPLSSVEIAAPYTIHAHAKDFYRSSTPIKEGFRATDGYYLLGTVIGQGVVPVKDCIECLQEAGYDGYVSVEFEGQEDNISALKIAHTYLKSALCGEAIEEEAEEEELEEEIEDVIVDAEEEEDIQEAEISEDDAEEDIREADVEEGSEDEEIAEVIPEEEPEEEIEEVSEEEPMEEEPSEKETTE
ncbi:MAG: sugar phosphate isomerase/epimerase, partial [Clostridia bacterium]|nr:sugar phosphate isomerase/epimerase [Clostridia bacterium]